MYGYGIDDILKVRPQEKYVSSLFNNLYIVMMGGFLY